MGERSTITGMRRERGTGEEGRAGGVGEGQEEGSSVLTPKLQPARACGGNRNTQKQSSVQQSANDHKAVSYAEMNGVIRPVGGVAAYPPLQRPPRLCSNQIAGITVDSVRTDELISVARTSKVLAFRGGPECGSHSGSPASR
ncbi:uncharacterized protein VTP21DRAFT_10926 [Calcarisporiella thermophila]|uniref:uncharacterized protein n=1 Tax=Calcarisporiella thermophila TaxID=911321 RepID=UPI003743081A